jgi:hypothetical protein
MNEIMRLYSIQLSENLRGNPKYKEIIVAPLFDIYKSEQVGLKGDFIRLKEGIAQKAKSGHLVPFKVIQELPQLLADPVMIFNSKTDKSGNSRVVVIDEKDDNGNPISVILTQRGNKIIVIPSIYGRNNFEDFMRTSKDKLLYEKKKEAITL